ncbi:pyruvate carboxyltransferase [Deinococcus cellulosilyticus]|uniref:HMGL-related enzyme n=1 Tax=Deinococcus cellulosilyticus (strain DSM 18568 / NBRC 106333 / KACC 11606 / 5516J-15) TaxID=1223518 RepID=A0A511N0W0_DEIC1|nr:pyruvate carboxyltransferase [Deinococcus cellulosilyticus]GEM46449.1 HMGL-related enzyme [Deinococcus cellulosilyticus NBRC 106333 = KACC 11606]
MTTAQYFPESFPQDSFPQYVWTEKPTTLPTQTWTTETTHRDGQQGGLPLTTEQGLQIFDLMCQFTGQSGAIRQAEFFVYRDADLKMLQGALERHHSGAPIEPTTWIRASKKDVGLIRALGIRETGMLASISDYHTFHKFTPGGREQATSTYLEAVEMVLDAGIRPRLHLEDATRADLNFMLSFIEQVQKLADPYGIQPRFRVCDTMGLGLPLEMVAAPRSVPTIIKSIRHLGIQAEQLEFHPHNDTHLAVANSLAAIQAGCAAINGTLLGKGERTGNAPLEGILLHLIGMGYFPEKPDFTALNALVDLYDTLGQGIPAKYPLYGKDAHRTRAGIHADGLNKFWWMYAPFDVPKLLGRPLEVSITKESGLAGLIFVIKQHRGIELSKTDPRLLALARWVEEEFDAGRQTAIEWEEIEGRVWEEVGV